jgi:ATP-dependent RNA helicase RhlE
VPEDYVHRIGRTGRAGATGQALSLVSSDEADRLRAIERVLGRKIKVLPLDRSGIRVPAERAPQAQPQQRSPAPRAQQRNQRPPQHARQRGEARRYR